MVIVSRQGNEVVIKKKPLFFYKTIIWELENGKCEVLECFTTD